MAETVQQTLKDLQEKIQAADRSLTDFQSKFNQMLKDAAASGSSITQIFDHIARATNNTKASKLQLLYEMVDEHGQPLSAKVIKNRIAKIESELSGITTPTIKIGTQKFEGAETLQSMMAQYKQYLSMLKKSPAELMDMVSKTIGDSLPKEKTSGASEEWKERTKLANKARMEAMRARDGYIKETQAIQELNQKLEELRVKRAAAEALPVTGKGKTGVSYATEASKASALAKIDKSITETEAKINKATTAAQKFEAQLIGLGSGKRLVDMKRALGVDVAGQELQRVPNMFERVIADMTARAQRSGEDFAKKIVNAEGAAAEAKKAMSKVMQELKASISVAQKAGLPSLESLLAIDQSKLPKAAQKRLNKQITQLRESISQINNLQGGIGSRSLNPELQAAYRRYQETLQGIIRLQDNLNQSQDKYKANISAIEGVTRRMNDNEEAIRRVQQRWEELNVKKQAGLINDKDFAANTQKLLNEYDRLIAKRKEFDMQDISAASGERKRKQEEETARARREYEKQRKSEELERAKAARAAAREEERRLRASNKAMADAVSQQVKNQRQLIILRKEYNALMSKPNKNATDNAVLDQTKKKIIEIINQIKQLNNEQKGSYRLGKQITDYDRLRQKIQETKKAADQANGGLSKMISLAQRLGTALGVTFSIQSLVQFGKKIVETAGKFEMQQVALRSILQNKQLADEVWDKTMAAALQSPFTAMQLTRYTKQLAAYRIETEKLFDVTKRLADVSAGLGVDMNRLILAYGQVKATNYLRASEVRQFTEAGINILGELSAYYADTQGKMVSTAQVMEMISKRMVSFKDVEMVFKRLTDEGGIFYNMQYVQSQTVRGQINKLHDAYDQMLYSMGKANQGVIKDVVSGLNDMVRNWRSIAVTIKSIGWGFLVGWLAKISAGILGIGKASVATKKKIVALRLSFEKLGSALKANLPAIAIGALVAVLARFVESAKKVKEINEEIDEQITTLYEASAAMAKYQSTIQKNNALINSNGQEISNNKERQEALNDALSSNKSILAKLKNDYPRIAEQLKQNANGTIENTNALSAYNDQLEREMTLLAMREQEANAGNLWFAFADTATEDLQDVLKNTTKVQTQLRNIQLKLKTDVAKMRATGNINERQLALANEFLAIPTEGDMEEALRRANEIRNKYLKEYVTYRSGDIGGFKYLVNKGSLSSLGTGFEIQGLGHTVDEFKREMASIGWIGEGSDKGKLETDFATIIENFADFAKAISEEYSGDVTKFIANNSDVIKKAIEGDAEDGIEAHPEIVKGIGDALIKAGFATTKEMRAVWNTLLNDRIIFTEENEDLNKIDAQIAAEEAKKIANRNQELLNELKRQRAEYKKEHSIDFFQSSDSNDNNNGGGFGDGTGKTYKSINSLISLLKEMNGEYKKLSKSAYGYAKSQEKVIDSFTPAFKEIFGFAGIDISQADTWSTRGLAKTMKMVIDKFDKDKLWGKFGKDGGKEARASFIKAWNTQDAEVDIDASVHIREDFVHKMEEAFSDYELTLELQKLNISPDVAKDFLSDFKYTTVRDLQDIMDKFYNDNKRTSGEDENVSYFDEEDLETYRKWANKIDAEVMKEKKERVKQFSKFLEKEYSERAKLEMQHAKDVAFVRANVSDEQRRDNIINNLNAKYEKDLHELNWKSFKESAFYEEMMDDLSSIPMEYMRIMLGKIEEILQNPEALPPRALKEAINARQKIIEAQMDFDQMAVMKDAALQIKAASQAPNADGTGGVGGKTWRQTKKNLDEEEAAQAKKLADIEKEINDLKALQGAVKAVEDAELALANANKALGQSIQDEIIATVEKGGTVENVYDKYVEELNETKKRVEDFTQKSQHEGEQGDEGIITITSLDRQKNATDEKRITDLETYIRLLGEYIEKTKEANELRGTNIGKLGYQTLEGGKSSSAIGKEIGGKEGKADDIRNRLTLLKQWQKAFANFNSSFTKFNQNAVNMTNRLGALASAGFDLYESLGGETNALTKGWKEFGSTITNVISEALTMLPTLITGFVNAGTTINAAMGIIGLIAEAIQLVITLISGIARLHDAGIQKELDASKERVEALQIEYDKLAKSIEKAMGASEYVANYNAMMANLNEQLKEAQKQEEAARDIKNSDDRKSAIKQAQSDIRDLEDEMEKLRNDAIKAFGGIADDAQSFAEGFVDAWTEAFLETGDGLEGLKNHFNEFLQTWFKKQALKRIAEKSMSQFIDRIDKAVTEDSAGGVRVDWKELADTKEAFELFADKFNKDMTEFAGVWDIFGDSNLSGLSSSIQGMTEEQADVLAGYWNSVRMYTASIDMNVAAIANALGVGGTPESNPMLGQLEVIANNTGAINSLLSELTTGNGNGRGIRVISIS